MKNTLPVSPAAWIHNAEVPGTIAVVATERVCKNLRDQIDYSSYQSLNEIESNNHPNRMEYELVVNEISALKGAGDLKIITYKLEQYDDMFEEIKGLVKQLAPLASDLEYIKKELNKLKDKEVDIPEVDLSGIESKLDNLSNSINAFEQRLNKLERKKTGGRF